MVGVMEERGKGRRCGWQAHGGWDARAVFKGEFYLKINAELLKVFKPKCDTTEIYYRKYIARHCAKYLGGNTNQRVIIQITWKRLQTNQPPFPRPGEILS